MVNSIREPRTEISNNTQSVLILGTSHTEPQFKQYIFSQLTQFEPQAICIESDPERFNLHTESKQKSSVGATAVTSYAKQKSATVYLIDKLQSQMLTEINSYILPEDKISARSSESFINSDLSVNFDQLSELKEEQKRATPQKYKTKVSSRIKFLIEKINGILFETEPHTNLAVVVGLSQYEDVVDKMQELMSDHTDQSNTEYSPQLSTDRKITDFSQINAYTPEHYQPQQ